MKVEKKKNIKEKFFFFYNLCKSVSVHICPFVHIKLLPIWTSTFFLHPTASNNSFFEHETCGEHFFMLALLFPFVLFCIQLNAAVFFYFTVVHVPADNKCFLMNVQTQLPKRSSTSSTTSIQVKSEYFSTDLWKSWSRHIL